MGAGRDSFVLEDSYDDLRMAYINRLPARADDLCEHWWRLRQNPGKETIHELRGVAHRLAGSGGMYGFTLITASARTLEAALLRFVEQPSAYASENIDTLAPLVDALLFQLNAPLLAHHVAHHMALTVDLPRGDRSGQPLNVLVVDDDPDISQLLISSLGRAGYRISSVTSGEDAITLLIEQPMDLIFLDVLMPGMSGLQVLECIRDADSWLDMAIILTTAHGSEGVAIDALRRGADDYLRKPFDSRDLRVTLGRTVGLLELRRQNASLQRQLEEKHRRLEAELARAALVQADLLPRGIPNLPGYDLAARCIPARDVGGDFYDWHMPNAQLLNLTFGDVMGKGMPAALLMTTVRAVMRSAARATSPVTNMTYAATVLEPDLERAESFVTMFHAQLDLKTNRLTYVDCGHGCVFIRHADGSVVEELEPRGIPLGVPRFDAFAEGMVVLEPGDTLIVYSDGLLDARPDLLSTGNWFLGDVIAGAEHAPAVIDRLIALVDLRFPPPDDLTIVALRRLV